MNIFQKKLKPKKLSLSEMWDLYKILGRWMGQKYVIDEVAEKLKSISPKDFSKSMNLMYDTVSIENPPQLAVLFIEGLKFNKFFEFQRFIETIGKPSG